MAKEKNAFLKKLILDVTPYEGQLSSIITDETTFSFPDGIPAFDEAKHFTLHTSPDMEPFVYMKSQEVQDLGFVCIDPFLINKEYLVKITPADLLRLELEKAEDAILLSFVTVKPDPKENTANLLAPLILNLKNKTGRQIILDNYPVRYNIWSGLDEFTES